MGYYTHKKAPLIRTEEVNIPFHTGWHDYPGQELPAYLSVFDVAPDINVEVYVVKGQTKVFYFRELLVNPETKEILVYGKPSTRGSILTTKKLPTPGYGLKTEGAS